MEKVYAWTTPEEAIREEGRYWRSRSVTERVAAVEALRRRTPGIYIGGPERLERTYRFVVLAPRTLPRRGRTRARRSR